MTALPLLAWMLACGGGSQQTPDGAAVPAPPQAVVTTPVTEVDPSAYKPVVDALSIQKPEPSCQDMETLVADPVGAYRWTIANVKEPTFTPIRATTCLLQQHPREAEVDALKWVADPEARSLTAIVLGRLDRMPLDSAKRIAEAALAGPHKADAKLRISRSRTPELKALAEEAP